MIKDARASADIVIREIGDPAEMRAVEVLQRKVWGVPDLDVVPLTQLAAARAAGGALLGAFDGAEMIGFVYGFAGLEKGRTTHHSHMLAVMPEYRNRNVGYKLKLEQREFVLAKGISEITWTFDPLQSLNAHFNFERLGVICKTYYPNFYGDDPASFLHQTGTDRLWVTWQLESRRVRERMAGKAPAPDIDGATVLVKFDRSGQPATIEAAADGSGSRVIIEIPRDINSLDMGLAIRWREVTRRAFTEAIAAGYVVVGFARGEHSGCYLLERGVPDLE